MPKSPPKPKEHNLSNEVIADARVFIRKRMDLAHDAKLALATQLHLFSRAAIKVRKATRAQHHDAVAFAYAIYAEWRLDPAFERLVKELADSIGKRITKRTDALHVILQAVISYGGDTSKEQTAARRLYSRDAQAIRYLMRSDILPSAVDHKASEKGEGLDAWAVRMRPKASASSEPADPSAATKPAPEDESGRDQREAAQDSTTLRSKFVEKLEEGTRRQMKHQVVLKTSFLNGMIEEYTFNIDDITLGERKQLIDSINELVQASANSPDNAQFSFERSKPVRATRRR